MRDVPCAAPDRHPIFNSRDMEEARAFLHAKEFANSLAYLPRPCHAASGCQARTPPLASLRSCRCAPPSRGHVPLWLYALRSRADMPPRAPAASAVLAPKHDELDWRR